MVRKFIAATLLALGTCLAAQAADSGDADTVSRLATSKHTLVEAIRQAEKSNGSVISAKFEYEDGKLWLGVYAAKNGRAADAEHNTLIEMKGEPNAAAWKPETEVFADKEHLTRSATQLTLMQLTKASLADLVTQASAGKSGTPYSATPEVKNGKPVVVVMIATPDGKTQAVNVDLR
jgi:hypothetical protein